MSLLIAIVVAALIGDLAHAAIRPYKTCPLCRGRGHCVRCNYTGKVLRFGAGLMHPGLRRKR